MSKWDFRKGLIWEVMGIIYIACAVIVIALEIYVFTQAQKAQLDILTFYNFFNSISSGLAIAAIGAAVFAYGVSVDDNHENKKMLQKILKKIGE